MLVRQVKGARSSWDSWRPLKNVQFCSSSRAITRDGGIGQPSGCPIGRSRRTAGESTRRFSADGCAQALEKRHFVQPQEYIEYFEGSADASLRAKSEPDAGTLVKL